MKVYEQWKIQELKEKKMISQRGVCAGCGKEFRIGDTLELAHRIPQRKYLIKLYGKDILHHELNMELTHSGYCNSAVQLSPNKTMLVETLVEKIRETIENEK